MMENLRRLITVIRRAAADQTGVVMTEAILVVPFLVLFAVGVLEFGAVFWQREQIATGLRDAVRYVARCRHAEATCDANARKIAYYGSTDDTLPLRVPGWDATNSPITITRSVTSQDVVTASTTHTMLHSPLFGVLGISDVTITLNHRQRDIGW